MTAILEMRGISKSFPGVQALRNVNLAVRAGEIHAICGENGAGKSTLMKILSGVHPHGSYEGAIFYQGAERQFAGIADSERHGIIIIHQELALVPLLSIAENIFLGNEPATMGVIDWDEAFRRTRELLARVGLKETPNALITDLGVGKQQLVEIAKALAKQVRLLILDEPTASLNDIDSDALLNLLLELKRQGIASILISHKLNELARVADSITVLRDGTTVETIDCRAGKISEAHIIKSMVGREMSERYPHRERRIGDTLFEIRDWRVEHPLHAGREVIKDVSLHVRQGEVVGIAGLMGSGRTELAMSVFGRAYGRNISGRAFIDGHEVDLSSIQKAVAAGLAYVTEDRKNLGLILNEDIKSNITLANLAGVSTAWRDRRAQGSRGRRTIPRQAEHPLVRHPAEGAQPVGRQPAEGGAQQMAVRRSQGAHPRRADARHRYRRQIRDLHHHQRPRGERQRRDRDIFRDARVARYLRPPVRHERRPPRR